MGKGHRDNHRARKKRGPVAFAKKAERRAPPKRPKCNGCGNSFNKEDLLGGFCPKCIERTMGSTT